eukprot:TRINITY_DN28219_c0_g1_i1.p1 TRINITY_DN28219_c0_g1~~TRINITY_DN28219_c0_g1_i1.p1  ORF type:complete len:492 (-),score=48.43 TRINITY_DN28219_c0_g1_i1:85-1560(-)
MCSFLSRHLSTLALAVLLRASFAVAECRQQYLESLGFNACVVKDRADLPWLESTSYEVSYISHILGGGSPEVHQVAKVVGLTHSGVLLQGSDGGDTVVLEYFALDFQGALIPTISSTGVAFDHASAIVGWYPTLNKTEWPMRQRVGTASADVVRKWFDWIPSWVAENQNYGPFGVWTDPDRSDENIVMFKDRICHTFSEDGLKELYKLGAHFASSNQPLCRNYMYLHGLGKSAEALDKVDTLEERLQMMQFYATIAEAFTEPVQDYNKTVEKFVAMQRGDPHAYVSNDAGEFFRVAVAEPVVSRPTLEPMHVPWDRASWSASCEMGARHTNGVRGTALGNYQVSRAFSDDAATTTPQPEASWFTGTHILVVLSVICCAVVLVFACSSQVASLFEGNAKRSPQKKRSKRSVVAAPGQETEALPLVAPQATAHPVPIHAQPFAVPTMLHSVPAYSVPTYVSGPATSAPLYTVSVPPTAGLPTVAPVSVAHPAV